MRPWVKSVVIVSSAITLIGIALAVALTLWFQWSLNDAKDDAEQATIEAARSIARDLRGVQSGSDVEGIIKRNAGAIVLTKRQPSGLQVIVRINVTQSGLGGPTGTPHCYQYTVSLPQSGAVAYKRLPMDRCVKPIPTAKSDRNHARTR